MKKFLMIFATIVSLGASGMAMASPCGPIHYVYRAPFHRVVIVVPAHRPIWFAWHRDHRFHRYF
jgi:hypothetical protein